MALSPASVIRVASSVPVGLASGQVSTANRPISVWSYATIDAAATVETAGYWNGMRSFFQVGDQVLATMAMGATAVLKPYVVTAVPATGNVVLALGIVTAG